MSDLSELMDGYKREGISPAVREQCGDELTAQPYYWYTDQRKYGTCERAYHERKGVLSAQMAATASAWSDYWRGCSRDGRSASARCIRCAASWCLG